MMASVREADRLGQQGSKMLASRRQLTRCRNSNYTSNPPMARGPSSDEKKPEPPPCPKCGKLLVYHASRMELDGKGNPETVHMFFVLRPRLFYIPRQQGTYSRILTATIELGRTATLFNVHSASSIDTSDAQGRTPDRRVACDLQRGNLHIRWQ